MAQLPYRGCGRLSAMINAGDLDAVKERANVNYHAGCAQRCRCLPILNGNSFSTARGGFPRSPTASARAAVKA